MKLRDWLTLVGIVGGLVLMFAVTRYPKVERVKPGTPEFDAYIERYVAECMRNPHWVEPVRDLTPEEHEAACRAFVLQADRFNPDARPLKPR
jgi:hypothetical protein